MEHMALLLATHTVEGQCPQGLGEQQGVRGRDQGGRPLRGESRLTTEAHGPDGHQPVSRNERPAALICPTGQRHA